jgi:hypothetical protein
MRAQSGDKQRSTAGTPSHARQLLRISGLAAVRAVFDRDPRRVERLFFERRMKGEVGVFRRGPAGGRKTCPSHASTSFCIPGP